MYKTYLYEERPPIVRKTFKPGDVVTIPNVAGKWAIVGPSHMNDGWFVLERVDPGAGLYSRIAHADVMTECLSPKGRALDILAQLREAYKISERDYTELAKLVFAIEEKRP